MRNVVWLIILVGLVCFSAGCEKSLHLSVAFEQDKVLRYEFVSDRQADVDLDPAGKMSKKGKDSVQRVSEKLEMVVAYNPVEADPYGINMIEATFEEVKVQKKTDVTKRASGNDAVVEARGRSYKIAVSASGKMVERSELEGLIKDIGEAAFRKKKQGRIKDPDMVGDFIAMQWFLWDPISSVPDPIEGVAVGDEWSSKQWLAVPMVMRKGLDVVYRLEGILETEDGRKAIISAELSLADEVPEGWPKPYAAGSFQMSGTFGFIIGYKILELDGIGEYVFNIDEGVLESSDLRYKIKTTGRFMLPLGSDPEITIEQRLKMRLLE